MGISNDAQLFYGFWTEPDEGDMPWDGDEDEDDPYSSWMSILGGLDVDQDPWVGLNEDCLPGENYDQKKHRINAKSTCRDLRSERRTVGRRSAEADLSPETQPLERLQVRRGGLVGHESSLLSKRRRREQVRRQVQETLVPEVPDPDAVGLRRKLRIGVGDRGLDQGRRSPAVAELREACDELRGGDHFLVLRPGCCLSGGGGGGGGLVGTFADAAVVGCESRR